MYAVISRDKIKLYLLKDRSKCFPKIDVRAIAFQGLRDAVEREPERRFENCDRDYKSIPSVED